MPEQTVNQPRNTLPERFQTARSTLWMDRFMNQFIKVGGISIITVVLGIFVFILWQVLPLFQGATVTPLKSLPVPAGDYQVLGLDEYSELPFLVDSEGGLNFIDLSEEREVIRLEPEVAAEQEITALDYNQNRQELAYGTGNGRFAIVSVVYEPQFVNDRRRLEPSLESTPLFSLGRDGIPIRQIDFGDNGETKLAAGIQEIEGQTELHATQLAQQRTLFGSGETSVEQTYELGAPEEGRWEHLLVNDEADGIYAATSEGNLYYFHREGGEFSLRQTLRPFDDLSNPRIASMEFLLGDVSLVLAGAEGHNRIFSHFVPEGGNERVLGRTKQFPAFAGPAEFYGRSLRNKAFLIGHDQTASLRYSTTEAIRWEQTLPYSVKLGRVNEKYDRLIFLDAEDQLHLLRLSDPHPEAGLRAMFGKIWYEGASQPKYQWQSTGGSDKFEPKLSIIPLIIGTLKGTFYAMVFAVPIALLAAVYTSQFAHPRFRALVKPLMEIMASLPSVVLGFLAALWLAPLIDTRVPSIILMAMVIPVLSLSFGWGWSTLPVQFRAKVKPGYEFLGFAPLFLLAAWGCWEAGPILERLFFVVTDPQTGERIADFRLWWPQVTGSDFEQRNSLVVGFAMGFAVIPIIFTITEDALSNVPAELRSGSLALGASRWQTAMKVVVPTASAGIFSALMIGLGRAVGETMIVVMATGNTPIMDWNIFSGMRTLSANIAVELPEAPQYGTLYRTLFLGALVLFLMTFVLNTIAEILRHRLREKYRLV